MILVEGNTDSGDIGKSLIWAPRRRRTRARMHVHPRDLGDLSSAPTHSQHWGRIGKEGVSQSDDARRTEV